MKINKVLFVSNDNENYISFWPSISKHFKKYLGLDCKLFFIGDYNKDNSKYLTEDHGEIQFFKPLKEYPLIIQCLWGKFWFTQTELDTNWLIGDIDLYPLNKKYYFDALNKIPQDGYGHLNANGYKFGNWYDVPKLGLPGYYHCAKGSKFKEFLNLSSSFEEDVKYIFESKKYGAALNGLHPNKETIPDRVKRAIPDHYEYICCEEHLSTERLINKKDIIHSFTYPTNLVRLESPIFYNKMDHDFYIDIHCPRPYTKYGADLEKILEKYDNN
jgi:hypothetical protein